MIELYKSNKNLEAVVNQTGYKDLRSLLFLYQLVKNINPLYILELGTGYGCSTIFMSLANNSTKIISIDDYRGDMARSITSPKENLQKCKIFDQVTLLQGDTRNIKLNVYPEIVFMDASHNKEDLQQEYDNFENILTKDHIIIIDDYSAPGVDIFVSQLSKKYELCFILNFHNGVVVLSTSINKYSQKINCAIREANNGI